MERFQPGPQRLSPDSFGPPARTRRAVTRALATFAVAVALTLWCVAEAIYPAGGWIGPQGDALVTTLAAVILVAACASGLAGLTFCALAVGALVCLGMDAPFASRALAAVSVATLAYALWQHHAAMPRRTGRWVYAAAVAATPLGLWLELHLDAAIYAAALGAFLTAYVLYAFARGSAARRGNAEALGVVGTLAKLPDQVVAVSTLLAVSAVGLLARAI
jgi:uncharacterized membrane protein YfcA